MATRTVGEVGNFIGGKTATEVCALPTHVKVLYVKVLEKLERQIASDEGVDLKNMELPPETPLSEEADDLFTDLQYQAQVVLSRPLLQ